MKNKPVTSESLRHGHEPSHRSLLAVFIIAASVVLMLLLGLVSAKLVLFAYARHRPMHPMQPLGILVAPDNKPLTHLPTPNLELDDGHADYMTLNKLQADKLNSYGWIDRTNGIVRIPIDRAMDLIIARGLPVAKSPEPVNGLTLRAAPERTLP